MSHYFFSVCLLLYRQPTPALSIPVFQFGLSVRSNSTHAISAAAAKAKACDRLARLAKLCCPEKKDRPGITQPVWEMRNGTWILALCPRGVFVGRMYVCEYVRPVHGLWRLFCDKLARMACITVNNVNLQGSDTFRNNRCLKRAGSILTLMKSDIGQ